MKNEITIPTAMIVGFIADNEKDMAEAIERGDKIMEIFHYSRMVTYQNLLDIWAKQFDVGGR